jgi:hypothetical protein
MHRSPRRLLLRLSLGLFLTLGLLGIAPPGTEPEGAVRSAPPESGRATASRMSNYEPLRAGHPLRIAAYVLHPVGVILDYAIFRPFYWVGSHEPLRTLFGQDD